MHLFSAVFDGEGQAVLDSNSKTEMSAIPLPAGMIPPQKEDRKIISIKFLEWLMQPSVIKRLYLIISILERRLICRHLGWRQTLKEVLKDFNEAKKKQ